MGALASHFGHGIALAKATRQKTACRERGHENVSGCLHLDMHMVVLFKNSSESLSYIFLVSWNRKVQTVAANRVAAIDDTDPTRKFSIDHGSPTDLQNPAEFAPKRKPIRNFSIDHTSSIWTRSRTPFLRTPFLRLLFSMYFHENQRLNPPKKALKTPKPALKHPNRQLKRKTYQKTSKWHLSGQTGT